jgi:hypothetical protein
MRKKIETLYTASELRELHPAGFERALERYRANIVWGNGWGDELRDSLNALLEAAGAKMNHRGGVDCPDEYEHIEGLRALAWMENRILSPLRIPWQGPRRWMVARYGAYYRPGMVPPCPFTGVCCDDDLLDDLRDSIRSGMSVADALRALQDTAERIGEREAEAAAEPDYFIEHADANELEYRSDGSIA